jgi:Concanavalin A-like lectin/glucanases superfamily
LKYYSILLIKLITMNKVILTFAFAAFLSFGACKKKKTNGSGNTCDPTTTSLLAGFNFSNSFDEISGKTTVSNTGVTFGADKSGAANSSAVFNGTSSYLALSGSFDKAERSVCFWLKTNTYPSGSNVGKDDAGTVMAYDNNSIMYGAILVSSEKTGGVNNLRMVMGHNTATKTINMDAFGNPTGWHHLALIQTSNSVKFYLDGTPQYETPISSYFHSVDGNTTMNVGVGRAPNGRFYIGNIDQFRFYSKALTACEVKYLFDNP